MPKEPVANGAMDSNRDRWLASPCARCHIVRGAIFHERSQQRAVKNDDLNDPDFIRPLTVSTRLPFANQRATIPASGRDLVDDGEKKRTRPEHSPQLDFLLRCPPSLGRSHPGTQRPGCLYHRSRGIERGQRAAQDSAPGAHGSPKKNVCLPFCSY
jgi:hypothetical protein